MIPDSWHFYSTVYTTVYTYVHRSRNPLFFFFKPGYREYANEVIKGRNNHFQTVNEGVATRGNWGQYILHGVPYESRKILIYKYV